MIAVITGNGPPFERLLQLVAEVGRQRPYYQFWVQHGGGELPLGMVGAPFVSHEVILDKLGQADAVVCHAGSGAIGDALAKGHHPIVVPRRVHLREIVNDHQLDLCHALRREGRVIVVEDAAELARALTAVQARERCPTDRTKLNDLIRSVGQAISEVVAKPRPRTRWRSSLARGLTAPFRRTLMRMH